MFPIDYVERKLLFEKEGKDFHESLFRTFLHPLMTIQIRVNDIDLSELGLEAEGTPS